MSAFSDAIQARSPQRYWRLGESSGGPIDLEGNALEGTYHNSPTLGVPGLTDDGDTAVYFNGVNQYASIGATGTLDEEGWIMAYVDSPTASGTGTRCIFSHYIDANNYVALRQSASGYLSLETSDNGSNYGAAIESNNPVDLTGRNAIVISWSPYGSSYISINGSDIAFTDNYGEYMSFAASGGNFYIGSFDGSSEFFEGRIDEVALNRGSNTGFNSAQRSSAYTLSGTYTPYSPPAATAVLPMSLQGFISSSVAALPMRLRGASSVPAGNLGMRLDAPDPSHYNGASARWAASVSLDGTDITSKLIQTVSITHTENQSGSAQFSLIPATGAIDPNDYERKSVQIDFQGRSSVGALLYTSRRFTGITTRARYNPDTGILSIEATTDLQGQIENISRDSIDSILSSATWSKHVFDEDADGWQYAQDRLSTIPAEIHVNNLGQIVVTDWAAKATPDVTLTDANRFEGTLRLSRTTRRDIISRNSIFFDFRFTRLRHREMNVNFVYTPGFCGYLNGEATLPQKSMIQAAATSSGWTLLDSITFIDLPETTANVCGGSNWVNDPGSNLADFCIGANWRAGRRWAQSVTEAFTINVIAPDIEEAVGVQAVTESYGIQTVFDSSDFENQRDFTSPPNGSVLLPESGDYQLDADETEAQGRTEMEAAQTVAINKAKTEILGRARGNRVSVGAVYDPSITLESTVRINTSSLTAKGKVYSYTETFNLDTGAPEMRIDLALSRHGGSGLAVDDPVAPPTKPDQTQEAVTSRSLFLGVRAGGTINAPTPQDDWDGYICNAYAAGITDSTRMYEESFTVRMPEIEESARDAVIEQAATDIEVAVPEDELTMSY